jgi:hypothetical protein
MRGTEKKRCEFCGTSLVKDEFDICTKCMSKNTPFVDDLETDEEDDDNPPYFDDDYDY